MRAREEAREREREEVAGGVNDDFRSLRNEREVEEGLQGGRNGKKRETGGRGKVKSSRKVKLKGWKIEKQGKRGKWKREERRGG